ncbi:nuclear transport factor 2 family protein [Pedobacter cryotolerans]|uniref:Nuclear transport factor 2 family protein n=1 Tax=Pedobacter cryotolerans TaxID=2571270 RepID=A0A4V5NY15_9SPHI|nr:nuclear transport factor 2 family protein [Pedobacter cryotolerans]TKC01563.1 nuclear transport factor 2 family protein [Pedobacter cryotolerans]
MKTIFFSLSLIFAAVNFCSAQTPVSAQVPTKAEQEVLDLSKAKWLWMSDKKVDTLNNLFVDRSVFVHMGGTWGKQRELDVIKSGSIRYKKAEIYTASVNIFGNTAILLNDIDLVAVVGGNEVVNPFMVTEVYIKENGKWKMGSLTFSQLRRPVKLKIDK